MANKYLNDTGLGYLWTKIKNKILSLRSPVENSIAVTEETIAIANHAKDSYLMKDGVLYKVTSPIAIGETLVVGTNISLTDVGTELGTLQDLTSKTTQDLSSSMWGTHDYCNIRRFGEMVFVSFSFVTPNSFNNGWYTIYELPFTTRLNTNFGVLAARSGETAVKLDGLMVGNQIRVYVWSNITNQRVQGQFSFTLL